MRKSYVLTIRGRHRHLECLLLVVKSPEEGEPITGTPRRDFEDRRVAEERIVVTAAIVVEKVAQSTAQSCRFGFLATTFPYGDDGVFPLSFTNEYY